MSAKENGWETQRLLRDDPLGQRTGVMMQDASTRHRRTNKHCGKARNEPDMFFFDAFGVVKRLWIYMYYMSMFKAPGLGEALRQLQQLQLRVLRCWGEALIRRMGDHTKWGKPW